ncbi:MAG: carboxymuconolactone decarboxylase family protein [Methanosarcinaceae archaeon]|nr:carboxymuconolactone decarboxylase family protein [Methanosarcinaceae archaeon]NKQ39401.1 carboxymuconolactone decarboxylase family protein [Methanosarcinales archaeon]
MKYKKFFGKGMQYIKESNPDMFETIVRLNESVFTGKILDYKTQKLIAIGIVASMGDEKAIEMQMKSGMIELNITKEEIMDALQVVLLTAGMPVFIKSVNILNNISFDEKLLKI